MKNDVTIAAYTEPRLIRRSNNEFDFHHAPHLGLFSTEPGALLVPTVSAKLFDPKSEDLWKEVKEGDIINVTVNKNADVEVWEAWDPPTEYIVADGTYKVEVSLVVKDALDYPVVIGQII